MRPALIALGLIAAVASILPGSAAAFDLRGDLRQGGLLIGSGAVGATVTLDGRILRVSPAGRFIIGFSRDAKPSADLQLRWADGRLEQRRLAIQQRHYRVQRIDGLPAKMVTPPAAVIERIMRENKWIKAARQIDSPEPLFLSGWQWPTIGRISGVYGSQRILNGKPRQPHYGIDIAAPKGTPVVAPADAVVRLAESDLYYTGGTLILDHGHGLSSAFLHLATVDVRVGETVRRGQKIGTVGSTGRSTGPHLDWRINWFDRRIDPAPLVPPMPEG
ncbi:MAG: M23 family metallopeptidase [Rhodospirillaceae bacterium]